MATQLRSIADTRGVISVRGRESGLGDRSNETHITMQFSHNNGQLFELRYDVNNPRDMHIVTWEGAAGRPAREVRLTGQRATQAASVIQQLLSNQNNIDYAGDRREQDLQLVSQAIRQKWPNAAVPSAAAPTTVRRNDGPTGP